MQHTTHTGGRDATTAIVPGSTALSIGKPTLAVPSGFTWTRLSSVARLESGHTPSRAHKEYWNGPVPWLSIPDAAANHGKTLLDTKQHISQAGVENSSTRLLPRNTVCLSRTASVGYVVIMGVPMCTSQDFINWICGPELDPRYLKYVLMLESETIRDIFAFGSTHRTLYYPDAKALYIAMPQIDEQHAIADVLGALDDKIASNSQMVHTLTELAQAHIEHLLLESNSQRLGDFADILMGSAPKGSSYNEHGDGVLLYQGMRDFGERWPSPRIWTTAPTRIAEANDILVSVRAPVGSINVASERCCIGRGLARIRTRTPATLYHLLRSQTHIFASFNSEGTVYGSINKDSLRELPLMVPNIGLEATELELAPLEARIGAALRESHTLVELRDALLPALMDGRIRVKDAVRTAEEAL